jgi:signal transduction histidine kinase
MNTINLPFHAAEHGVCCYPVLSDMQVLKPSAPIFIEKTAPVVLKDLPGKFVTVLAHEIRNPLTNINLAVEMLSAQIQDEALQTYLDIIMRGSLRINSLLNELFAYQQQNEVKTARYSIRQLLEEVLAMAGDRIALKHIKITTAYDLTDGVIILNRLKMKIALTNIIINAIDSISGEGGELKLSTGSMGDNFSVHIEDNGCGISKENLQSIFNPFYSNKPGGVGIGLAATYDILRSNRVGLTIESELTKGTHFILLFNKHEEPGPDQGS